MSTPNAPPAAAPPADVVAYPPPPSATGQPVAPVGPGATAAYAPPQGAQPPYQAPPAPAAHCPPPNAAYPPPATYPAAGVPPGGTPVAAARPVNDVESGGKYTDTEKKPWALFGLGAGLGLFFSFLSFFGLFCIPVDPRGRKYYSFGCLLGLGINFIFWIIIGVILNANAASRTRVVFV